MEQIHLSQRLATVAQHIQQGDRIADIGSDHAYLPIALVQSGRIPAAVAGEVVPGPFHLAEEHVAQYGLAAQIKVRLADGLAAIKPADRITAVTIAGMGGTLIHDILEAGYQQHLRGTERLILQPNVGENRVREWLLAHQYAITAEEILEEDQHIYEVIAAAPSAAPVHYDEADLYFGPFLRQHPHNSVFQAKWQDRLQREQRVLRELQKAQEVPTAKAAQHQHLVAMIEEVVE
ncbi:tRNA (adenine(22)-N(1))-methyltransferase [Lactobacillus selangorensis]|uniref:tRNA (adenine(22)-N(1))-methyltransferase n=1 Tax=Lactobacillus selangorensis TaxID=81857 RepID=UPI000708DDE8|nr:tRNA (adenine(22)-N(1))-methyltransferase TrmK [Lactobacillus selangorensis]